ncbi:MAG: AarF/ABC1/UbiB kinase family protein [Chloracidobacterium sp.]|nr:AarF/ABC1/UbiB kinase family protein [Chloracidobacterium sp.]
MSNLGFEATTLVKERSVRANGNGGQHFVSTDDLAIAKLVTNKQLIAEEKFLQKKEAEVESVYHGWRGYWRLFQISRVIVMLAAYLYLDQFDMHRQGQLRHKKHRMQTAMRLTRMAVYGEKLYSVRLWFAQRSTALARRFVLGSNSNREHNQERQAIWLKEKLIELGPTFIKIGQSMGTRADLLPLPFVKELGTLVDSVPPFPNEIAFARIEHELGCKINEMYAEFELGQWLRHR